MRIGRGLQERVQRAVMYDNSIIADKSTYQEHPGVTLEQLENLGLSKSDLKRLCSVGLAVMGYGRDTNQYGKAAGHVVKYMLFAPGDKDGVSGVGSESIRNSSVEAGKLSDEGSNGSNALGQNGT